MGWEVGGEEDRDILLPLVEVPEVGDVLFSFYERIYALSYDLLSDVAKKDIVYRARVSPGKPLIALKESSKKSYAMIPTLLCLFVSRVSHTLESGSDFERGFISLVEAQAPTRQLFLSVLLQIIEEPTDDSQSVTTILTKFFYAMCHTGSNDSMLSAEKVGQLCARIKYMIKMVVLFRLVSS
jgi:hypothetical protein